MLALSVAAVFVPSGGATTAPGARTYIKLSITAHRLTIGSGASAPRGGWVIFHVHNDARLAARISLLGKSSKSIAPRQAGEFVVFTVKRGAFPLTVSLGPKTRLRQTFVVY